MLWTQNQNQRIDKTEQNINLERIQHRASSAEDQTDQQMSIE